MTSQEILDAVSPDGPESMPLFSSLRQLVYPLLSHQNLDHGAHSFPGWKYYGQCQEWLLFMIIIRFVSLRVGYDFMSRYILSTADSGTRSCSSPNSESSRNSQRSCSYMIIGSREVPKSSEVSPVNFLS